MTTSSQDAAELLRKAMQLHEQGELAAAAHSYEQVLAAEPEQPQALRLAGILAREAGDLARSTELLSRAAASDSKSAAPLAELALTRLAAGELEQAEAELRHALEREPMHLRALANLGAVLLYRGHIHGAIEVQRELLERAPDDPEILCNLAQCLLEAGEGEGALAAIDDALDFAPGHPLVLAARGSVLCALEQFEQALTPLAEALAANPQDDMALTNLGYALASLGRYESAAGALRRAVNINPDNARAAADLLNLLHRLGDSDEAISLGRRFLTRHPGERLVLATLGLVLHDQGEAAAAAAILDAASLVRQSDLVAVEGYDSVAEFNQALKALIDRAVLLDEPLSKATRGGGQTGELDVGASPVLEAFRARIAAAVAQAVADLRASHGAEHPLLAWASERWTLRVWATVLDSGGHQTPHMHPQAWFSGVYYVSVPDGMGSAGQGAGNIEFGQPPERYYLRRAPLLRQYTPAPGRLLLFPSWLYHRTLPFTASEARISLAFDVVPLAG